MQPYAADSTITGVFETIWALLLSALQFVTGNTWLVLLIGLPVAGWFLYVIFSLFQSHKGG